MPTQHFENELLFGKILQSQIVLVAWCGDCIALPQVCLLKADCHGCEAEAFRSGKQLLEAGAVQVRALRLKTGYEGAGD